MSVFDIANELTRPFRIPRKRGDKKDEQKDDRKKRGGPSVGPPITGTRSPLEAQKSAKPQTKQQNSYGNRIVPLKRKATSSTEVAKNPKHFRSPMKNSKVTGGTGSPVDQILSGMTLPSGPKKFARSPDRNSGSGSAKSIPKPAQDRNRPESYLSRERLEHHLSFIEPYSFKRKGLMEALLEHKMKTGRVDPHSELQLSLSFNFHPPQPEYGEPEEEAATSSEKARGRRGPMTPPGSPDAKKGPRTPSGSPPRKPQGPATPVDSPPPDSSNSESGSFRGRSDSPTAGSSTQDLYKRLASAIQKQEKERSSKREEAELLSQIASIAQVDVAQIKSALSPSVFKALKKMDSAVLLATVSTVLSTIAQTVEPKPGPVGHAEVSSSCVSPHVKQDVAVTSSREVPDDQSVEMEIASSNDSFRGSYSDAKIDSPPHPPIFDETSQPPLNPPPPPIPPPGAIPPGFLFGPPVPPIPTYQPQPPQPPQQQFHPPPQRNPPPNQPWPDRKPTEGKSDEIQMLAQNFSPAPPPPTLPSSTQPLPLFGQNYSSASTPQFSMPPPIPPALSQGPPPDQFTARNVPPPQPPQQNLPPPPRPPNQGGVMNSLLQALAIPKIPASNPPPLMPSGFNVREEFRPPDSGPRFQPPPIQRQEPSFAEFKGSTPQRFLGEHARQSEPPPFVPPRMDFPPRFPSAANNQRSFDGPRFRNQSPQRFNPPSGPAKTTRVPIGELVKNMSNQAPINFRSRPPGPRPFHNPPFGQPRDTSWR